MAAETITFKIDDQQYEVPDITDLDMDEWQVMYEYTGLVLDDFVPSEDAEEEAARMRLLRQPGFTRALLHIGYQRANPDLKSAQVKAVTGKATLVRALEAMDAAVPDEDDADPPASTSEPEESSQTSSLAFNASGSVASLPSSDPPGDAPAATGTGG